MKKFFAIMSFVLCFAILQFSAFAADLPTENKNATKISVSFKAGTGAYTVNGKNVKGELSTQTGGKTFVPANVIIDALGATLNVDLKAKTAVINYNSVDIKLTEKKKEAVVAGKKINIDAAPYIKNKSFMVSITSLADMLGADVSTSNDTITFTKEIANPNSIKDFSSLIKNTKKLLIGDSYYNWSMQLPDELKLEYRNFNGSENIFVAQDESYIVTVNLYDADSESNLDNAVTNIKEKIEDFTLIDFTENSSNGEDYVEFIYSDNEWTVQERCYITKTTEYDILIYTKNDDSYDDEKYQNLMTSFNFKFDKTGSTEDLSDVTKEGYRKYQDTRLKWTIDMIPYFEEIKDEKIQNKILFFGKNYEFLTVEVYSMDKGETLDSVTKTILDDSAAHYNSELYSVTKQEKIKVDGTEGNRVNYTITYPGKFVYGYEMFFTDNSYKYIVTAQIPEEVYNNSKDRKLVEGMLNSFSFKKLDAKVTGKLLDPAKVSLSNRVRTVKDSNYTIALPINWSESENNNEEFQFYYGSEISLAVAEFEDVTDFEEFISFLDTYYGKKADYKLQSKTVISDNSYKYVFNVKGKDNQNIKEEFYVIHKGNKAYSLSFMVDSLYYSTMNKDIINKVWQSFSLK